MAALAVLLWIPAVLVLDRGASLDQQRLLGLASWVVLALMLWRQDAITRLQVLVVVVYASLIEYTFSAFLETYVYRLYGSGLSFVDKVPAFVPPGHGMVYLAAVVLGRRLPRWSVPAAAVGVSAYAIWGLVLSPRLDVLGALWAGCLLWWLWRGSDKKVYAAAFLVVTYLEILGTGLGTWAWQTHDPVLHWIAIGNPPSGAAGGYCFFDAAALAIAPVLLRRIRARRRSPAAVSGLLVQPEAVLDVTHDLRDGERLLA